MPFLVCKNLERYFAPRQGLAPLSFALDCGERLAVRGASGSGKTTLLRLLAGLETPSGGEVWEDGRRVNAPRGPLAPHRRSVGMLFQNLALWPHLRVREQIELVLPEVLPERGDRRSRRRRALDLLARVGLEELADRHPAALSAGERQRAAWVRATAAAPRLLLLDEPMTALDPGLKDDLVNLTREHVRGARCTLVVVTHDEEVAQALGQRQLVL